MADESRTGVAIVGMACRFPGAPNPAIFWRNLCEGVESISSLSDEDLLAAGATKEALQNPIYVKAASLLPDHDRFDAAFFEYSPHEARLMDPQQRILLEVAWEAFEDAGYRPGDSEGPVGVYVATGGVVSSYLVDRLASCSELPGATGSVAHLGNDKDFPSTRISYKLNLTGPSINVQTACSSSLVAIHLACQAILAGECAMALAGGGTVRIPQHAGYVSGKGGILSPDGHCRAFDADAQGTIFGSGVGVVLLKALDSAIADRDNIYAVIRGSAINNDGGRKVSYTASSVPAQARAMVEAMAVAGASPDQIGYVECHGTGTVVGDPLEIDALTRAFRTGTNRRGFCAIGSVKTNIGHLEQTAGVAALIKTALVLKNGRIPPSLHFKRPNPKIDFESSPFFVNASRRDWPRETSPRVAAVNALGLGGTNAFAVLEERPVQAGEADADEPAALPYPFSAKSSSALEALIARHRDFLSECPNVNMSDLSFTLTAGRTHFPKRFFALADTPGRLKDALMGALGTGREGVEDIEDRRLAFLFSGQGSQYVGMGKALYRSHPVFRDSIDRSATILRDRLPLPLVDVLFGEDGDAGRLIDETAFTQPALFVLQTALVDAWRSVGVVPDVVMGHSVGEFAAAYCAGVYTFDEAIELVVERARLMQAEPPRGTMASIFADEATVVEAVERLNSDEVVIAAVNAPKNIVVSGDRDRVLAIVETFSNAGVRCQQLSVSHAFHSPLVRDSIESFGRLAASIRAASPRIPWFSTAMGRFVERPLASNYWRDHGLGPVRFAEGMNALEAFGVTDLVEIGPGGTLLALGQQSIHDETRRWLASLEGKRGDCVGWMSSVGALYRRGYAVEWDGLNRGHLRRRISLPTYPFERQRYWLEDDAKAAKAVSRSSDGPSESLAGTRLQSPLAETQFEGRYSLKRFPYLEDHRIYGLPVLPTTGAIAALCEAASQHFGGERATLRNLQYRDPIVLPESGGRIVQTILSPIDAVSAECRVASSDGGFTSGWRTHIVCLAELEAPQPTAFLDLAELRRRCPSVIPAERYYSTIRKQGLEYGPGFRQITALFRGEREVLAHVVMPEQLSDAGSFLHPAMLDACLHTYAALAEPRLDFDPTEVHDRCCHLPIEVERFRGGWSAARDVWVHTVRRAGGDESGDRRFTIDVAIHASDGARIAEIYGLTLKRIPPEAFGSRPEPRSKDWLYQAKWIGVPALSEPGAESRGRPADWLVLADRGGVGSAFARRLEARGDRCCVVFADDPVSEGGETWRNATALVENIQKLVRRCAADKELPFVGVVALWSLDTWIDGKSIGELEPSQRLNLESVLSLVRAIVDCSEAFSVMPRIWLVTRGVFSISTNDPPADPAGAALWGLGRSVALEHPPIWGALTDLGVSAATPSDDAALLVKEILAGDGEDQIALRRSGRFALRLVREARPAPPLVRFDVEGRYLVTGGFGALGIETAKWLVSRRGAKHLILASRRGERDPKAPDVRAELTELGANLTIASVDLTNEGDVRRLFDEVSASPRPLKGIFHCAGLLDDGILLQMNWEKLWRVMAPKVAGGWLLSQLSRNLEIDCFVVFSSILSVTGSAGQSNYTAANAFLDALVERRRAEGLPAQALNFGPWAESGLAVASGDKGRQIWRSRGTEYISSDLGVDTIDAVVGGPLAHAIVTLTKWPTFLQQFADPPRLYDELRKETAPEVRAVRAGGDPTAVRLRLKEAAPQRRRELLVSYVLEQAMSVLGFAEPIDAERALRDYGLDSLMSVTLVNRLETTLGVKVRVENIIKGPSVRQLADDLAAEWPDAAKMTAQAAGLDAPKAARPNGKAWLVVAEPRPRAQRRLFCFPFAGGGSSIYHNWADALDPSIEVVAIEPPGRLSRIGEKPIADIDEFVDKLVAEMAGSLDRPFAFFGHCLGGLTLYETARRLIHSTNFRPLHLFVSGARPPDQIDDTGPFEERLTDSLMRLAAFRLNVPPFGQADDVFGTIIRHFNIQATDELLDNPELRNIMLPVIRAEFKMATNYEYEDEPPWDIPITCFVARDDPYVSRHHALGWGFFTDARLQVHMREGAHFAVVDDATFIHNVINRELIGQDSRKPTD